MESRQAQSGAATEAVEYSRENLGKKKNIIYKIILLGDCR